MSIEPDKPDDTDQPEWPPDGRGPRPTDPNELAKWLVDRTTSEDQDKSSSKWGPQIDGL